MENNNFGKIMFHKLSSYNIENIDKSNILQRSTVKLLTYNFFLRPPPIKTNEDDYKEERLNDFVDFFQDFDIICFQELFGTFHNRKHKMIQNAAEHGFFYNLSSRPPSFFSKFIIDGGLVLLSRFPIIDSKIITYDYGVMSDGMCMKGAIYAKIQIKNSILCLFTTHLQASYFDSGTRLWNCAMEARTQQTKTLVNFIYDTIYNIPKEEREKCKFILCGDFNIDFRDYISLIEKYNLPKRDISEYDEFVNKLSYLGKINDLIQLKYNNHPYTFGVNDEEFDKVLTGKEDLNSNQSLDYIFEIIPNFKLPIFTNDQNNNDNDSKNNIINNTSNNNGNENLLLGENNNEHKLSENDGPLIENENENNNLAPVYDSVNIEYFLVKNKPYQQLSDHFGVSVELKYS